MKKSRYFRCKKWRKSACLLVTGVSRSSKSTNRQLCVRSLADGNQRKVVETREVKKTRSFCRKIRR
jgi:hypothetical protein